MKQSKKLRPYQTEAIAAAKAHLKPGSRTSGGKLMMVLPTGSGKTLIIAEITKYAKSIGLKVLVITPRKRLFSQTVKELPNHGQLSGKFGRDLGGQHWILATTYQTAAKYEALEMIPDVVLIDECHMVPEDGSYADLLKRYPNAVFFGMTATPYRSNSHIGMSGLKWKTIYKISISKLISDGYLVAPVSMFTAQHTVNDDADSNAIVAVTHRIAEKMVTEMQSTKRKRCVFFCKDIAHATLATSALIQLEEKNVFLVHSEMTDDQIDKAYTDFEMAVGRSWLINVGLLSVGVDIPCIDCIAILRDVKTFALMVQIIGRGLRLFNGKTSCHIYDFGYGLERFGFIDDPKLGKLEYEDPEFSCGQKEYSFKPCPQCYVMNPFQSAICKCGSRFDRVKTINIKDYSLSQPLFANEVDESDCTYVPFDRVVRTRGPTGNYIDTYTFIFRGRELEAKKAFAFEPPVSVPYTPGKRVLVKRIAGDLVEIV